MDASLRDNLEPHDSPLVRGRSLSHASPLGWTPNLVSAPLTYSFAASSAEHERDGSSLPNTLGHRILSAISDDSVEFQGPSMRKLSNVLFPSSPWTILV
jgi:hypothetical protein